MSIITRMRKQSAVYWGSPVSDGVGGWTWASPVQITCRWEDSIVEFKDETGQLQLSKAVVYVDQDVDLDGFLYLGTSASLPSDDSDPTVIAGAYRILRFDDLPNIKATEFLKTAYVV